MKFIYIFVFFVILSPFLRPLIAQETFPVRLKDIAKVVEVRDNQLMGFGLVVGLRGTGDSSAVGLPSFALKNLLNRLGVSIPQSGIYSRNTASVLVTATLPAFSKKGQVISVSVSSLGDSTSLEGGVLLMTPLKGADFNTYAVAQGPIIVGGIVEESNVSRFYKNQSTVGKIPQGAIIENEVPVTFFDPHNITVVLHKADFSTASNAVKAMRIAGFPGAKAIDPSTIKIPLSNLSSSDLISTLAKLEDITLVPDLDARIVINARTGTVVIGEHVRLYPVAVTHGGLSVRITNQLAGSAALQDQAAPPSIEILEETPKILHLKPTSTLSSLVNALNEIGATSKDLIAIIQALKHSGALIAEIEVM